MSQEKTKAAPMVAVTWTDAAMSCEAHWQDGKRPKPPKKKAMHLCVTVGFLVHLDDQWVQLIATVTENAHAHLTEIPVGMVKQILTLEPTGELKEKKCQP
jgi:hypothetical protein